MDTETIPTTTNETPLAERWVYFDGRIRRYGEVTFGLMTHALNYGTGCFEGVRAYWNEDREQLYLLQGRAHYKRMHASARILRMTLPHSVDELIEITLELLRRNAYRQDVYLRPLLFASSEELGAFPYGHAQSFGIYTAPEHPWEDRGGLRCAVSTWRRISDSSLPARAKLTGAYVNSALAKAEASESGFDDAIMLSVDGHVAEAATANVFLVRDGTAITPPVTDDILEGVTRRAVIGMLETDLGIPVIERSVDRTELYACDELFLCGTGAEIEAVIEVDRRAVGDGVPGPLTTEVRTIYDRAVRGELPGYMHWLTPVY
jgi:branched-chain amino acid aminotransferase